MALRREIPDYADLAIQAQAIDHELNALLEELLATLDASPAPEAVEAEVTELANASQRLAQELQTADLSQLEQTAARIDALAQSTDRLLAQLPDAIIAAEHDHWSAEMETIRDQVRDVRSHLGTLSLPHLKADQRAEHEMRVQQSLHQAKSRLHLVRKAVRHRAHISDHPMHQHLHLLRQAVHSTREHVQTRWQEHCAQARSQLLQSAYHEMREFFSRQMSGRLYADSHTLQLRSDLTGRLAQWDLDEPHAWALAQLLGPEGGAQLTERIRAPGVSFAAHFEVSQFGGKPMLTLDGGERTIVSDTINYRPIKLVSPL